MADKSGIQVARETKQELELLKNDVEHLTAEVERAELRKLRQANAVLEEKVTRLEKRADASDKLLERVAVLESQQADLRKAKDEADKRQWQFVYLFAGSMATLLVTLIVQLVLYWVKK